MALQVWLPLRGDLTNYGLSKFTFATSAANITIDDNGKIGKCYQSVVPTGANSGIYSADNGFMDKYINHKSFSLCAWINTIASNTPVIFLSYGLGLSVGDSTHVTLRLGDSTRTISCVANVAVNDGQWHHVAGTYDTETNKLKIYIDGVLKNTVDYVSGITYASSWVNGLFVYRNPNNSLLNEGYFYNGKANDIRVYDHCLSGQEVKDISMGLVAHYQLKDSAIESTTNLCTNLVAGGRTTLSADKMSVTTNGTEGDTYFDMALSETLVSGTTYTLSMYATGMPEGKEWIMRIGNLSQYLFSIYNGYNKITFTANDSLVTSVNNRGTKLLIDDGGGEARYAVTIFSHCQLEKRDHATPYTIGTRAANNIIYDSSGYGNNGTAGTSLTVSNVSSRYSLSTVFDGTSGNGYIEINSQIFPVFLNGDFTISMWIYSEDGDRSILFGNWGLTGAFFNLEIMNGRIRFYWNGNPSLSFTNSTISLNNWILVTITRSGNTVKSYINGVLKDTSTTELIGTVPATATVFRIGRDSRSDSTLYKGKISDFRLYVTALSAEDVKNLYQTAAHAFQNGYSAYEFVEG